MFTAKRRGNTNHSEINENAREVAKKPQPSSVNWVLHNYQYKLFIGSYHNFTFLAPNSQESQVIGRVQVSHYCLQIKKKLEH